MSKLTHTLNCGISFVHDYCLIQDLSTKRVIGRGREYESLYILELEVQRLLLVLKLLLHSNYIVAWVIHLSVSKMLYPQFSSLSSLNCESCQYAKLHRVHLSPRVNKRASASFEFVHYDAMGPCLVMSPTRFKYFVTFVDDFSRVT